MQHESSEFISLEQGQYTLLLQKEMSDNAQGTVYFTLPNQDDYLYEYEGDLDEALGALPELYEAAEIKLAPLTPQAAFVLEQLWNYFDQTGEQLLEGQHEYSFKVEEDTLLILPKDISREVVAVSRDGQIESSFGLKRFEHLMERFAIAYQQMQIVDQKDNKQDFELG